jgi:hypothetical protein
MALFMKYNTQNALPLQAFFYELSRFSEGNGAPPLSEAHSLTNNNLFEVSAALKMKQKNARPVQINIISLEKVKCFEYELICASVADKRKGMFFRHPSATHNGRTKDTIYCISVNNFVDDYRAKNGKKLGRPAWEAEQKHKYINKKY